MNENNFLTEFLAEVNLMLTQPDEGNRLFHLLSPVKNYFLNQNELLSFSLARYCGSSTGLAFFAELWYQVLFLTQDAQALKTQNQIYFEKKVPIRLRGLPNLQTIVGSDVDQFCAQQLAFLNLRTKDTLDGIVSKNSYMSKYLNDTFLCKYFASCYHSKKIKYQDKTTLSEFLEGKSFGLDFVRIGLPCLLGFCHSYNQDSNNINAAAIKWSVIEDILKNISLLYTLNQNNDLDEFLYIDQLTEKEEFEWWQLSTKSKFQKIIANGEIRTEVKLQKSKIQTSVKNLIESTNLPGNHRSILSDLLGWAMASVVTND